MILLRPPNSEPLKTKRTTLRSTPVDTIDSVFTVCRRTLGRDTWGRVRAALDADLPEESFPAAIDTLTVPLDLPGYLADLARLEWVYYRTKSDATDTMVPITGLTVNPSFTLQALSWKNLASFFGGQADRGTPVKAPNHVMTWRHPQSGQLFCREALENDLLSLKIAVERIDPRDAARQGQVTPGNIQAIIEQAVARGILLAPDSRVRRNTHPQTANQPELQPFQAADIFTLQWHVTQKCDLHCKHCYDRSNRTALPLAQARAVLDDFYDFCRRMHVRGQVTFSGGNPLLYPHLEELYRTAHRLGFGIAILGNPTPVEQLRRLVEIVPPLFFQISLEGLEAHNDFIRGAGHFKRSLAFLDDLRELGIYSMVMLTLTRDNLDQVLPLADLLKGRTDAFNFNRLAAVGEGAGLLMPTREDFKTFLRDYQKAAGSNPILGFKDNLFNLIKWEGGEALLGGCTGFGCGAAFNFLSLLSDGEVHACRKFPSLIGNIQADNLYDIYHSQAAADYRAGSAACENCAKNLVCRGCLAVAYSLGLDIFTEKDPFCDHIPSPPAG